jgi:hypothetical protein
MTPTISETDQAGATADPYDSLSKQRARAVMFVLLLAVLMALSAIFLIMSSEVRTSSLTQDLRPPA